MKRLLKTMAKKLIGRPVRAIVGRLGYDIAPKSPIRTSGGFKLYQYTKPDGTFDYERYRRVQTEGNKQKIGQQWALEENISFLSDYINRHLGKVEFGICHGTRQGMEQAWFKKYLGCRVIGTEISDTADQFPDTIQWDFHEVKPEWVGACDFIYSNSFDHSYDPEKCIQAWMSCVKKGGFCILEQSEVDEFATELDPFGAEFTLLPYLILTWSKGEFCVREILDAPKKTDDRLQFVRFVVIEKL
jgi:hypothetical protein